MSGRAFRALRALTLAAAVGVVASAALLLADAARARGRAGVDAALVAALEARTRLHAEAAAALEAEREAQTERSLAREARNTRLGWVLLAAAAVLVTGAKGWIEERAPAAPCHGLKPEAVLAGHSLRSRPARQLATPRSRRRRRDLGVVRWLVRPSRGAEAAAAKPAVAAGPEVDLAFVDELVARHGRGREGAIGMLQAIQGHYRYLPDAALARLCELTEITPALLAGTATFYARFRTSPVGEHLVRVCHGTACHVAGARHVDDELRRRLAIPPGADTDPEWRFTLAPVACVGCCSLAPVIMVGEETAGRLTPATAGEKLWAMTEAT